MSDPQQTSKQQKSSTDRRNGGGSRHNSESDNPSSSSATPSATRSKSDSGTPVRPGSSLAARVANSTPRLRSRPAPVHSLSTPLGRSLSMRVSKKEKRWSMRLEDSKSLRTSTYKDDYQSPEALSLHSLNLETTTEQLGSGLDLSASTTYRESYRWQPRQYGDRGLLRSKSDDKDTPSSKPTITSDHSLDGFTTGSDTPVSSTRTASRNGQVWEHNSRSREQPSAGRPVVQSPTSRHSASFFRRNASSGVIQSSNDGQSLASTDRRPCASASKDRAPMKPANEKGMSITKPANEKGMSITKPANEKGMSITKPANEKGMSITKPANEKGMSITKSANGNSTSVNGEGLQNPRTPQTQKLTNGVRGWNVTASESEDRTPRRSRAYQLQSSNGGSPFPYGSDLGSGV